MLCVFVLCEMSDIYYRHTSPSSTCSRSDTNLGMPEAQSPSVILSRHCGKRLLDGVDTSRGLALGKQREQKGRLVNTDCHVVHQRRHCARQLAAKWPNFRANITGSRDILIVPFRIGKLESEFLGVLRSELAG